MTRHRWSEPTRFPEKTKRFCLACGLIRVTRHVDDGGQERGVRDADGRLVWVEWWTPAGDGMPPDRVAVTDGRTPACEAKAANAAKEAA